MATINDVVKQSEAIASYVSRIRTEFNKSDVIRYFSANRNAQQSLIDTVKQEVKCWRLILDGYAEKLASMNILQEPPILPLRGEVPRHQEGWLDTGDIISGWSGYLVDRPRVVVSQSADGVRWRYVNDDAGIERSPTRNDPHLIMNGWEKMPVTASVLADQVDEIYDYQGQEITALNTYLVYFRDKQYLE